VSKTWLGRAVAVVALACAATASHAATIAKTVEYYHLDGLGSVRAVSDSTGALVAGETRDYLAFGEEWCVTAPCGAVTAGQPKRFTGKERDAETGLDYFGARYYGARLARFTSVDPHLDDSALSTPQRWNRYSYVENNPLSRLDPDGQASRKVEAVKVLWRRSRSHIQKRHVSKAIEVGASKFKGDYKDAKKLMERVIAQYDSVELRPDGVKYYRKKFGRAVGTEGETIVEVRTQVVGPNTERVLTGFPVRGSAEPAAAAPGLAETAFSFAPGVWVMEAGEAAVEAGGELADWFREKVENGWYGDYFRRIENTRRGTVTEQEEKKEP